VKIFKKIKRLNGTCEIYAGGVRLFSYKIRRKRHQVESPKAALSCGLFPPSQLANKYLKGLRGIEIGGAAHNQFFLNTLNVNFTEQTTCFTRGEIENAGDILKVDIVANGDDLPFKDNTVDFVINSHVLEHFWDPIKTLKEWLRVVKPNGYVFLIIPHKERTFDKDRTRTPLQELIDRHNGIGVDPGTHAHFSVWVTEDFLELCRHLDLKVVEFQDIDDKVGNGFSVVIQKEGFSLATE
jgi:SAM-dependent methyltransferase